MYFLIKILTTAIIIAAISELSKRYSLLAALLASLPLTSILAFIWIYWDSKDTSKIIELSYSVFWLVLTSLAFFLILPYLINKGFIFPIAMAGSIAATSIIYVVVILLYKTMIER